MVEQKEFKINEYITLKLENKESNIYVKGELFNQCTYILLRKRISEIEKISETESIDELADVRNDFFESSELELIQIPIETQFWVHCSNMQVWAEHNYDARLLHRNLAFPLLKRLTDAGDPLAKKVFKDEIAKRFVNGNDSVRKYLLIEQYLSYLNDFEIDYLMEETKSLSKELKKEIALYKYKPELFVHLIESNDIEKSITVKTAVSYLFEKIDGKWYCLGCFFGRYGDYFFIFTMEKENENSFENYFEFDYRFWVEEIRSERNNMWNLNESPLEKEKIDLNENLFDRIQNTFYELLEGEPDSLELKKVYLYKFKPLPNNNNNTNKEKQFYYMSEKFEKKILYYLSNHWSLQLIYKKI